MKLAFERTTVAGGTARYLRSVSLLVSDRDPLIVGPNDVSLVVLRDRHNENGSALWNVDPRINGDVRGYLWPTVAEHASGK